VVVVGKVPDARLAALFKGAVAVVAPSLEEGFGLATIEAFGFGTPVITSDRSPMREVAGGAAALVDPTSTDNLAAVMRLMLTDAPRRDRLRHLGEARYRGFVSAVDYARNIAAAYRSAARQATADARAA
jgi:glycosyltransferase involved in cell wall biosynthesis